MGASRSLGSAIVQPGWRLGVALTCPVKLIKKGAKSRKSQKCAPWSSSHLRGVEQEHHFNFLKLSRPSETIGAGAENPRSFLNLSLGIYCRIFIVCVLQRRNK